MRETASVCEFPRSMLVPLASPPLPVGNNPQRLIRFHHSDGTVFVELTTLWRWLSDNLKSAHGERRLAMTLRRRGYHGAKFTAPTDGPSVVQHVELSFATHPKARRGTTFRLDL